MRFPLHRLCKLVLLLIAPCYAACSVIYLGASGEVMDRDWASASHASAGLAPDPEVTQEPVIQIYAARVAEWHGYFGVHTWIAVKRRGASQYTVYEVTQAQLESTGSAVAKQARTPDGHWYGNRPELLSDVRGPGAEALIERIDAVAREYPHAGNYRIWPGPNSNTFVAHIGRAVPELQLDLPATAVGKDYLGALPIALTSSGSGAQFNVLGLLGVAAGLEEGVEINVLGLTFGLDPNHLGMKLPMLGRVGGASFTEPRYIDQSPRLTQLPSQ